MNKIILKDPFIMPDVDEVITISTYGSEGLLPNCWLWNDSVGYLEVLKYNKADNSVTITNNGRRENAKPGTTFPGCLEFLIDAPTALSVMNNLTTCLKSDFTSPEVDKEGLMSVESTSAIREDDQIIVDRDYRYLVVQVINNTTLKVRNEGMGKDGIIKAGCNECVPVQTLNNLLCCPIPTGDLTSTTNLITVTNGADVLLDDASLTLDNDLSKYNNATSKFITLNDVPRGTLSSLSSLISINNGTNNVLANISLNLDTDLSKYDNTTSEFLSTTDKKNIVSSSSLISISGGTGATLETVTLDLDNDLSLYDNTTSRFLSESDKRDLTSNSSLITVTNGTGSTLKNASLSLNTDLSLYDNTTSSFLSTSDKKNLTSTSPIITINNGTGTTLENTSISINTDLSQYDNSVSQFITAGGLASGSLSSNTSVLTVYNGADSILTNVALELDTDLSQYDNSVSKFITLNDIPTLPTVNNATLTLRAYPGDTGGGTFTANASTDVTINMFTHFREHYHQNVGGNYTAWEPIAGSMSPDSDKFYLGISTIPFDSAYINRIERASSFIELPTNGNDLIINCGSAGTQDVSYGEIYFKIGGGTKFSIYGDKLICGENLITNNNKTLGDTNNHWNTAYIDRIANTLNIDDAIKIEHFTGNTGYITSYNSSESLVLGFIDSDPNTIDTKILIDPSTHYIHVNDISNNSKTYISGSIIEEVYGNAACIYAKSSTESFLLGSNLNTASLNIRNAFSYLYLAPTASSNIELKNKNNIEGAGILFTIGQGSFAKFEQRSYLTTPYGSGELVYYAFNPNEADCGSIGKKDAYWHTAYIRDVYAQNLFGVNNSWDGAGGNIGGSTNKWNNVYAVNLNGAVSPSSDIKKKENIVERRTEKSPVKSLDTILKLKTYNYVLKEDITKQERIGIMAQELREVEPVLVVNKAEEGSKDEDLYYDLTGFVTVIMEAVQELAQDVADLKKALTKGDDNEYKEVSEEK